MEALFEPGATLKTIVVDSNTDQFSLEISGFSYLYATRSTWSTCRCRPTCKMHTVQV